MRQHLKKTRKTYRASKKNFRKNIRKSSKKLFKGGDEKHELDKLNEQLEEAEKNLIDYRNKYAELINDNDKTHISKEEELSGVVIRLVAQLREFKPSNKRDALIKHFTRSEADFNKDFRK